MPDVVKMSATSTKCKKPHSRNSQRLQANPFARRFTAKDLHHVASISHGRRESASKHELAREAPSGHKTLTHYTTAPISPRSASKNVHASGSQPASQPAVATKQPSVSARLARTVSAVHAQNICSTRVFSKCELLTSSDFHWVKLNVYVCGPGWVVCSLGTCRRCFTFPEDHLAARHHNEKRASEIKMNDAGITENHCASRLIYSHHAL